MSTSASSSSSPASSGWRSWLGTGLTAGLTIAGAVLSSRLGVSPGVGMSTGAAIGAAVVGGVSAIKRYRDDATARSSSSTSPLHCSGTAVTVADAYISTGSSQVGLNSSKKDQLKTEFQKFKQLLVDKGRIRPGDILTVDFLGKGAAYVDVVVDVKGEAKLERLDINLQGIMRGDEDIAAAYAEFKDFCEEVPLEEAKDKVTNELFLKYPGARIKINDDLQTCTVDGKTIDLSPAQCQKLQTAAASVDRSMQYLESSYSLHTYYHINVEDGRKLAQFSKTLKTKNRVPGASLVSTEASIRAKIEQKSSYRTLIDQKKPSWTIKWSLVKYLKKEIDGAADAAEKGLIEEAKRTGKPDPTEVEIKEAKDGAIQSKIQSLMLPNSHFRSEVFENFFPDLAKQPRYSSLTADFGTYRDELVAAISDCKGDVAEIEQLLSEESNQLNAAITYSKGIMPESMSSSAKEARQKYVSATVGLLSSEKTSGSKASCLLTESDVGGGAREPIENQILFHVWYEDVVPWYRDLFLAYAPRIHSQPTLEAKQNEFKKCFEEVVRNYKSQTRVLEGIPKEEMQQLVHAFGLFAPLDVTDSAHPGFEEGRSSVYEELLRSVNVKYKEAGTIFSQFRNADNIRRDLYSSLLA